MAHRKESVRPEAEIDYQAKKNIGDNLTSVYKKSKGKQRKLREDLKATIPSREHSWPKWLGGYKDTEESKRIKKELKKTKSTIKFVEKREKSLEKLGGDPITKHGTGAIEKRRLLKMGVYRDKKGGQVLNMKGGGIALRGLGRAFVKGGKV
jgi:hypothetical protein